MYVGVCVGARFLITLQVWNILNVVTLLFWSYYINAVNYKSTPKIKLIELTILSIFIYSVIALKKAFIWPLKAPTITFLICVGYNVVLFYHTYTFILTSQVVLLNILECSIPIPFIHCCARHAFNCWLE